jgi:nitrogen fixation protein NifB
MCNPKGAGSCGGCDGLPAAQTAGPEERIARHPCYSSEAHLQYARMHVPVAPACNMQCHYCNRRYDCSNESRPGVTSRVLTPDQALTRALNVMQRLPNLSVLGIAGPGDPLANPDRTFRTFALMAEYLPHVQLCLSTNGLRLPEFVGRIQALGVGHVTVTINAVDPAVGAELYGWMFWNHRRIQGRDAAAILLEQQLEGVRRLTAAGILCKINSVLVPGVNDHHLPEVSRAVRSLGAFIHNVMPLIPAAGSVFGDGGVRAPSQGELAEVRARCGGAGIKLMQHCRQCRADAIGLLGEDLSQEFAAAEAGPARMPIRPVQLAGD